MGKIIKNLTVGWTWSGDTYALRGFNVAVCPPNETPKTIMVAFARVDKDVKSYTFKNITIDDGVTYTAYVQALFDTKDSDWKAVGTGKSVTDDGSSTVAMNSYVENIALIDGIASGGVFTGSFDINTGYNGGANDGEVRVNVGKFVHPNGAEYSITGAKEIVTGLEGASSPNDWRYIAFVGSDWTRFTNNSTGVSNQFIAVKFVNGVWKYDSNTALVDFTPSSSDCIVAKITGKTKIDTLQLYAQKNVIAGSEADGVRDLSNDDKLTPLEKHTLKKDWDLIKAEYPQIIAQASTYFSQTTKIADQTNYETKYTDLDSQLSGFLTNLNTTSDLGVGGGVSLRAKFSDYFDAKAKLLKDITDEANRLVNNTQKAVDTFQLLQNAITIDNTKTTLFYYNDHLCSTKGDNPNSGYKTTLRYNEGKFGNAIAVEEGTTNLISGDLVAYNNFSTVVTGAVTILDEKFNGFPIYRLTITPDTTKLSDFQTVFHNHGVSTSSASTFVANKSHQASIYWRTSSASDIQVSSTPSNIFNWNSDTTTYTLNNEWKRTITQRNADTTDKSDRVYFGIKCPSAVAGTPIIVDFACPQLEAKDFATSYTSTTRAYGKLNYGSANDFLSTNKQTVLMWVKKHETISPYNMCMSILSSFYMSVGGINSFRVSIKDSTGVQKSNAYTGFTFDINTWYLVGYTFENGTLKMYINGNLVKTVTGLTTDVSFEGSTGLNIGCYTSSTYVFNGLIDETILSKEVFAPELIKAIYDNSKNFYDLRPIVKVPNPQITVFTIS